MSDVSGVPLSFGSQATHDAKLPDVGELMIATKEGNPKALLANAITLLRYHPEWCGVLGFDEFSLYSLIKKPAPWSKQVGSNWTDYDDSKAADWLQHSGILVSSKVAGEAVQTEPKRTLFIR